MIKAQQFNRFVFTLCLVAWVIFAYSFRASAQETPAPQTATDVEISTPAPEPTPDDSITVKPDGTVDIPQSATAGGAYEKAFNALIVVLVALIVAGGGYAIVRAFKTPEQAKTAVNTVLDIMKMAARFTPTPADDVGLETLQKTLNEHIDAEIAKRTHEITAAAVAGAMATMDAPDAPPVVPVALVLPIVPTVPTPQTPGIGQVPPDEPT